MNNRKRNNHGHSHSHSNSNNDFYYNNNILSSSNFNNNKQPIGVAILDTGIYRHADFDNRIIAFVDFVNGQMMPYDDNGHGSHVRYCYTHKLE